MNQIDAKARRDSTLQHICKFFAVHHTVYLSGPMTGLPHFNKPAFNQVKKLVALTGATVLSPADLPEGPEWNHQMRKCFRFISDCSHVVMLPGWENSKGALIEHLMACQVLIPRLYLHSDMQQASPYTLVSTDVAYMTRFMTDHLQQNQTED